MEKKVLNGKTWIIIGVVVVILAVFGVVVFTVAQGGADQKESLLELGQRYLDELDYEQAVVCFEDYLEIDPKSVKAYAGLAQAYVGLEEYEKALEVLENGFAVTGAASLRDLSVKIEEKYGKHILADGETDTTDGTDGGKNHDQETGIGKLMKPLVLDTTTTNVIEGNGGVIIIRKAELYGAINYLNEEIVPQVYPYYAHIPTEEGYFALGDAAGTYVFDSQGELVYEITEDYRELHISEGVILYSLYSDEGKVCWYDLTTKKQNSVDLVFGASITQMQNGKFNAWRSTLLDDVLPEDVDMAFWTVDKNGSVEKNKDAVWGFDSFDYTYIRSKADGYIPMILWEGFGLLSETGEYVVWSRFLEETGINFEEIDFYSEFVSLKGYYRDGLWLYNKGMQVVVTDRQETHFFLLDLSKAVTAPAVQGGTADNSTATSVGAETWLGQPAGRITNIEDVLLAHYDFIQLSDSGYYLASDGESWFYLDERGQRVDQTFLDCGAFYNGYAIVIDMDGLAYLIDTDFNKVSDGYPADRVYTAEAIYCAVSSGQVTIFTASEE